MTDPKATPAKPVASTPAPAKAKESDEVFIPPKTISTTAAPTAPKATVAAAKAGELSSVGAQLHPEAEVSKVQGKVTLDAGGSHIAAAPQPTPAEAVSYPSTGGLPDTGPNSKYVLGSDNRPQLYNADGERVNADGQLIDDFGDVIPDKGVTDDERARRVDDRNMMRQPEFVSEATKAEMDAGRRALSSRR